MKVTALKTVFVGAILGLSNSSMAAGASGSLELMCRTKAKEIAAETYKNCVTDVKQTQVKNLRKEYEEKLAALKSHYDKELKKISKGEITKSAPSSDDNIQSQNNKSANMSNNTDASSIEVVEIPAEQE